MKTFGIVLALFGTAAVIASVGSILNRIQPAVVLAAEAPSKEQPKEEAPKSKNAPQAKIEKIVKTNEEWKKILPPATYYVMREEGTERAFSGDYNNHAEGIYKCAACGLDLFNSDTKFDSRTGWPSFWKPIAGRVEEKTDADGSRTEVRCVRCDGHLGHVFDDGPAPTGLRYCMNSVALKLEKK